MTKALILAPGERPELREVEDKLENWQEIVGGFIEPIRTILPASLMLVNDEGWIRGGKPNEDATSFTGVPIAGTAVIIGDQGSEFVDVPDAVLQFFTNYKEGA